MATNKTSPYFDRGSSGSLVANAFLQKICDNSYRTTEHKCHGKVPKLVRDVRLRGGFEKICCLALSYFNVLKRFPIDKLDRNFRCLFSKISDVLFNVNFDVKY